MIAEKWGNPFSGLNLDRSDDEPPRFLDWKYRSQRRPIFIINGQWVNYRGDFQVSIVTDPVVSLEESFNNQTVIKSSTSLTLKRINREIMQLLVTEAEVKYRANGRPVFFLKGIDKAPAIGYH